MANLSLNTGLRALLTARSVLSTIGHNISNANTVGYSRQRVDVAASIALPSRNLLIGSGVNALTVQRSVDELLQGRLLSQVSISGGLEVQLGSFQELESIMGEPDGNGVGALMNDFFSRISELSTAPSDSILRTGVVQSAVTLSSQFNLVTNNLSRISQDVEDEARLKVARVNEITSEIADLNQRIAEVEASALTPNDLLDERDRKLEELSDLMEITTIQTDSGAIRVAAEGNILVGASGSRAMELARTSTGGLALQIEGVNGVIRPTHGELGGLLQLDTGFVDDLGANLDQLARQIILESNRIHSTGVNSGGPFQQLVGEARLADTNGNANVLDERLSDAGLPFDVSAGTLHVNVTQLETGQLEKHDIEITSTMTVGGFLDALNEVPNLTASLDPFGRVRIAGLSGYGFDFSNRLDPNPDPSGTFGGANASLGSATGPFDMGAGGTLDLVVDPGGSATNVSINFPAGSFDVPGQATAQEMADVINADTSAQSAGLRATVQGDLLFLQRTTPGSGAAFQVSGGSAAVELGWSGVLGQTISGHTDGVELEISGSYTGEGNDAFTFRPVTDGMIGTTPGLQVDVFDASGARVATLDLGEDYVPGTELEVAEGVNVSFSLGELSATDNDAFVLELVDDADTSDVLVAMGLNSFFSGSSASDIRVRKDIEADPARLATSQTGSPGDNTLLLQWLDVENKNLDEFSGSTLGRFYGDVVGGLGFETSRAESALESNSILIDSLRQRRDTVSGVNVDEELVNLQEYEQAFAAAARFINVVNQINTEILNIL